MHSLSMHSSIKQSPTTQKPALDHRPIRVSVPLAAGLLESIHVHRPTKHVSVTFSTLFRRLRSPTASLVSNLSIHHSLKQYRTKHNSALDHRPIHVSVHLAAGLLESSHVHRTTTHVSVTFSTLLGRLKSPPVSLVSSLSMQRSLKRWRMLRKAVEQYRPECLHPQERVLRSPRPFHQLHRLFLPSPSHWDRKVFMNWSME